MPTTSPNVLNGKPLPFGACFLGNGVNFSLFARNAKAVSLLLFEAAADARPFYTVELDSRKNRSGDIWHCFIQGLEPGVCYLYKVDGPYVPEKGLRFNKHKLLLDPYARAIANMENWAPELSLGYEIDDTSADLSFSYKDADPARHPKAVVASDDFDWQGDIPLNYPLRFSVLYETHVRGFTANGNSGVAHPGTYLGLIEKIPYLKELGITSLELLPIHDFYEDENDRTDPQTGHRLKNYWGYSTVAFFAPKASYSWAWTANRNPNGAVNEFKTMVRELHKAGIEVILDIVFNHTAEGNERGLTYGFRGLDNSVYYMLDENQRYYKNYSGCGNTVNCNHPITRSFIIDCLHYWVVEMHVDGFRFDLAAILGRDQHGNLMENPPVLERIAEDPILANTKIIAEAWDAGGAYQVGHFPGGRWAEWNDRYRDGVRKFWRGDKGELRDFATRLAGSSDLYLRDGRKPFHSINFITSHDGFTLADLVSYNGKHNENNGENNRDGNNNNYSYNYGVEGDTERSPIRQLRLRQMKNFAATLMLSLGTPMMLGGDEIGRTQNGNNNAYCQDNEISWYNWDFLSDDDIKAAEKKELFRFIKEMIAFRKRHPGFMRPEFYTGVGGYYDATPDISWFAADGGAVDWDKTELCLAFRLDGSKADIKADRDDCDFYIMMNASSTAVSFSVCNAPEGKEWVLVADTGLPAPNDILPPPDWKTLFFPNVYYLKEKSLVILASKTVPKGRLSI
ncbi:MAG: glycogen debranching protein GlgX [Spirochaetaceae bacterium]|jgi:glycogen operon protein|nr:glycogen debranching protein GlgX [Spirochaetaceae bacterium]